MINTTPKIHWISEVYRMINEEQHKFDDRCEAPKELKLLIDFETSDMSHTSNQMIIPDIKYKKRKSLKKEEIDLSKKSKNKNSLF